MTWWTSVFMIIGVLVVVMVALISLYVIIGGFVEKIRFNREYKATSELTRIRALIHQELKNQEPSDEELANSGTIYAQLMAEITDLEQRVDVRLTEVDGVMGNVVVALKQIRQEVKRANRRASRAPLVELEGSQETQ